MKISTASLVCFSLMGLSAKGQFQQLITVSNNGIGSSEVLLYKQTPGQYIDLLANDQAFAIFNSTTNKYILYGNNSDLVGIGTSSPSEKLTVAGNVAVLDGSGYHVQSSNGLNWANTKLIWRNWDGIDYTEIGVPGHSANQAKIRLNANGNVGIGTSAPPEKLSVNGKILATEIRVATVANWPDYVFRPGYRKMTLRETESFISRYGHLPEIPHAASVEKDGIQLAEMNKLLLKKIEELTLHLIEKDHQMEQMEKTNQAKFRQLQEEINLLKKKTK